MASGFSCFHVSILRGMNKKVDMERENEMAALPFAFLTGISSAFEFLYNIPFLLSKFCKFTNSSIHLLSLSLSLSHFPSFDDHLDLSVMVSLLMNHRICLIYFLFGLLRCFGQLLLMTFIQNELS